MHHNPMRLIGAALTGAGVALEGVEIGLPTADLRVAAVALLVTGLTMLSTEHICDVIRQTNRPADEAWSEGYEAGYDRGWRDGDAGPRLAAISGGHAPAPTAARH